MGAVAREARVARSKRSRQGPRRTSDGSEPLLMSQSWKVLENQSSLSSVHGATEREQSTSGIDRSVAN